MKYIVDDLFLETETPQKFGVDHIFYSDLQFCPECGTIYLKLDSYDTEMFDQINSNGIHHKHSEGRHLKRLQYEEKIEVDGIFERKVVIEYLAWNDGYHTYIKDTYHSFSKNYIDSRDCIDRIEILKDADERECRYCKSPLIRIGQNKANQYLNQSDDLFMKATPIGSKICSEIDAYIDRVYASYVSRAISSNVQSIDLPSYIAHLCKLEADIRLLVELLFSIKLRKTFNDRRIIKSNAFNRITVEEKRQQLDSITLDLLSENITPSDVGLIPPYNNKPTYLKPGLFNKKKVEAENKRLEDEYKKKIERYEAALKEATERELARRKLINQERTKAFEEKQKTLKSDILQLEQKLSSESGDDKYSVLGRFYDDTIVEMQDKLRELCCAKKDMLSIDIIHPKYQDFVALTTIGEYLETGRCTELVGPNGAYNLYEQEIRANRVIAQLDEVISNLEDIKRNQYNTYRMLCSINNTVGNMNKTLDKISVSVDNIMDTTKRIEENTDVIAYNTNKTAELMRVQNELTNALGYLVALQ